MLRGGRINHLANPGERQLDMARRHWASATRSFVEFPRGAIERSIPERFEAIVDTHADKVAIAARNQALTYGALNQMANRLARMLVAKLGTQNEPAAFLLEPGASPIIATLGALKAGKIYVALDSEHPVQRLGRVLRDSQARVIVTNRENQARADELGRLQGAERGEIGIIVLDDVGDDISGENLGLEISHDLLAAIFYTSGTAGKIKGVMHSHRTLLHRMAMHTNWYRICSEDRELQFFSYNVSRSLSFLEMLLNGGTVLPYDIKGIGAAHLAEWLIENEVTILPMTGGLFNQLVETLPGPDVQRFPKVRLLAIAGEMIAKQDIALWQQHFGPDSVFLFHIGSTEAGRIAQILFDKETRIPEGPIPVGFPSADKEIILIDENGCLVEPGHVGEIVVKSHYLSAGYWRNPTLTQAVFRSDPEGSDKRLYFSGDMGRLQQDGALEYVGRKDFQVKIRGHTVQLNEVEMALLDTGSVKEAVAIAQPRREGGAGPRLIAYLVANSRPAPTVSDLRGALMAKLPDYMVPSAFVFLDALPRAANGKVNRKALPAPEGKRPEIGVNFVAPRSELEKQLASIWEQVLDLDRVGIHDNFFYLGGDSLSAMFMALEVENFFNQNVPPDYFRDPTIAVLAKLLEKHVLPPEGGSNVDFGVRRQRTIQVLKPRWQRLLAGQIPADQILRWVVRVVLVRLDYDHGVRWLRWTGHPVIANRLYPKEGEYFRDLAESMAKLKAASPDAFNASVASNVIGICLGELQNSPSLPANDLIDMMHVSRYRFWRSLANRVDQQIHNERNPIIQFSGLEHLYHSRELNRGTILLTYHNPATPIANAILSRYLRLGMIPTLSKAVAVQLAGTDSGKSAKARELGWSATFALQGQRILAKGGIVQIVNDVTYDDGSAIAKSIGGRQYDLKPGFAELALITGATILPVYTVFDRAGVVHMTFLPALKPLEGAADHGACVEHLLDQYVLFLEETWQRIPESIDWGSLKLFHVRPIYAPGASSRTVEGKSH